jgi:carboxyl-terminal processing protease
LDRKADSEQKSTTVDVAKLLRKLKREKVDGVILDLRRNGGGSLEEAINLTGLFIKDGPVVQVKDYNGKITKDLDTDPTVLYDGPLIVLTSRFSASASEILAGALQDYGRALIVGDSSTHGKGTVQSLIKLDPFVQGRNAQPGAVKLTIRKFYRASGASTQLKGVTPDMVLPSPYNYAEVGESALENPLPWDTIPGARYERLDWIQPILPELQVRSTNRLGNDPDFAYLHEDIELYRKNIKEKTVSLNEEQRLKEKRENDARQKAREAELKSRPENAEKVYEISLKQADLPGLPAPVSRTNEVAAVGSTHAGSANVAAATTGIGAATEVPAERGNPAPKTDAEEEAEEDASATNVDTGLKEAKRILMDLISLWPGGSAVAATN